MWTKLKEQYQENTAAGRFLIVDEFLSVSKQPDETLTALCARLEDALQKVKGACPPEMTLGQFQEEMAMMTLIRALPEEFGNFCSSLLLLPGSLDLKTVKEAFLQEERNRMPRTSEQMAMKASGSSSNRFGRSGANRYSGPACTFQGCKNPKTHSTENCFMRARALVKRADEQQSRRNASGSAKQAEGKSTEQETAEFAGNASAVDPSDPFSPLVSDAGADWVADTGATSHMTPHRHWFTSYTPTRRAIRLADDKIVYAVGKGSVRFSPLVNGRIQRTIEFHDVLHVPPLRSNLLSVLYLTRCKEYTVFIDSERLHFNRSNQLLLTAQITSNNAAY